VTLTRAASTYPHGRGACYEPAVNGFAIAGGRWRAVPVGEPERAELLGLFQACEEFWRATEGRTPSGVQVDELLHDLPPGRTPADKHVLGLRGPDGGLAGVLDVVRGYPAETSWFIGLLLLAPEVRGHGLGDAVCEGLEAFVRARGGEELRLAVLEQNAGARRFWEQRGFVTVDSVRRTFGNLESVALRMAKPLVP